MTRRPLKYKCCLGEHHCRRWVQEFYPLKLFHHFKNLVFESTIKIIFVKVWNKILKSQKLHKVKSLQFQQKWEHSNSSICNLKWAWWIQRLKVTSKHKYSIHLLDSMPALSNLIPGSKGQVRTIKRISADARNLICPC